MPTPTILKTFTHRATHLHIVLLCAGSGTRLGLITPKQFALVKGERPLFTYALDTLLQLQTQLINAQQHVHKVMLHLAIQQDAQQLAFMQNHLSTHYASHYTLTLHLHTTGGATRAETVLNTLTTIQHQYQHENQHQHHHKDEWVMIHDSARPHLHIEDAMNLIINCLPDRTLTDVAQHATLATSALLAKAVQDTVKYQLPATSNNPTPTDPLTKTSSNIQTLPRAAIFLAQTPQLFKLHAVYAALMAAKADNQLAHITDEAQAMEMQGEQIKIIPAKHLNDKVTLPIDWHCLNKML